MSSLHVRPFEQADIADAGALLAQRHRRHRLAQPLLSARYEDPDTARAAVAQAWQDASGAVAFRGAEMVGFLVGAPKSDTWGPNVWIESAGQAATEAEAIRDLYGFAAARWVQEGRTAHYVLTPASDAELVQAWFRLGFGQQHAHGLRAVPTQPAPEPAKVTVRRAAKPDIPILAQLDLTLPDHQALAPTFSAGQRPTLEESLADWESDYDNPDYANFVAEYHGEVIGSAVATAIEKSGSHTLLARPDRAALLGFAAVFPHARGIGAGRALGEAVLDWAAESGFTSVVADWRVTNLLSSRAWPALGFAESFLRLHRLIGY